MTTKKALLDGLRLHMMKLSTPKLDSKPIDPTDDDQFARPVTLQRRDPRQPAAAREIKVEEPERPPMDEQEAERLEKVKAEKEAQKAIDQAKIAPVAKDNNPKPKKKNKEEKTQFHRTHKTEAARKEAELRYEEALPWHLEDADGKNVWVGEYIASLSGNQVAFRIDGSSFRMVPLEKFYKFTSKPAFKPLSIDEAEDFMGKKMDVGRWVMKGEEKKAEQAELEATRRLLGASGRMVKTESSTFKAASRAEKMEHDDLDVSGDEFQDDDEATTFERNNDEDEKDSKERIRREQLGANLFGEGDEKEVERELNEELKEELERRKYGKSTKKALIKRDREDVYESDDSEDNPWSSSVRFVPSRDHTLCCWLIISRSPMTILLKMRTRKMTKARARAREARASPKMARTLRIRTRLNPVGPRGAARHRARRRARALSALALPQFRNLVETNQRGRRSPSLPRPPWEAELAHRLCSMRPSNAKPKPVLAQVATRRSLRGKCRMAPDPRRRSS
jgi:hypothetical protein